MRGGKKLQLSFGFDKDDDSSAGVSSGAEQEASQPQQEVPQSSTPSSQPEERKASPSAQFGQGQHQYGQGPEPSQDLSYKWVMKFENVQEVERSVVTSDFRETMTARELDAEFRLLRKLTETKEHQQNQETLEKKASGKLNRYAELRPCKFIKHSNLNFLLVKHTRVRLLQRNEDIHDSYINANYINSSIATND